MGGNEGRLEHLRAIFERALELDPAETDDYLEAACAGDAGLRADIESLLTADRDAPAFLDRPVRVPPVAASLEGVRLGAFRVVREIGRGGMSVVYLGMRADEQFEQRVAIKVLPRDASSSSLAARFLAERRILASLDHRSIVGIVDGGVTPDDRPYLVMDHIEGERIDAWCDRRRATVAERLRLFCNVLDAVAYAHRSLVVHRDLKPANILVTSTGEVRLLDFGIAKLLDPDDAVDVAATQTGVRALTPEYASPEQIRGERITTACDTYALGVLLYELLSGRRPYRGEPATPWEVEQAVIQTEPERPSAAIRRTPSTAARSADDIAAARRTEPERLRTSLDGDLDAIVLKALRKAPEDRYASADAFREDIDRYLGSRPVLARRGSRIYHVRKFVRRHRTGVAAAAAALILAVAAVSAITASRAAAQREARTAQQVTAFLVDVFGGSDPFETLGDTVTARTLLDRGRQRIARQLEDQPLVRASLLESMGQVYSNLGRFETADTLFAETLALRTSSGAAEAHVVQTLHLRVANWNAAREFPSALEVYEQAFVLRGTGEPDDPALRASLLGGLAEALRETGQVDSARAVVERALALDRARGDSLSQTHFERRIERAMSLRAQERFDSAALAYADALPRMARALGEDHPDYGLALNNLAFLLTQQERWAEAVPVYREGLAYVERVLGPDHPRALLIQQNLGSALFFAGDVDAALAVLRARLDAIRARWPEGHWRQGGAHQGIGRMLLTTGRAAEAEAALRDAVASFTATLGADHPWTLVAEVWVVTAMTLQGDARAPALLDRAGRRLAGVGLDADTRFSLRRIADHLEEAGRGTDAEAFRALVAADESRAAGS